MWAAISTIWLIIPMMIFGLIFLAVLVGLIYLLARALDFVPPYTAKSQYHVNRGSDLAKRYSNIAVRPILFIEGITASLKTLFGKK